MKDEKITRLETELKDTKGIFKVLISLLGEELAKKAIEKLRQNDLPTTDKDGMPLTLNKMLSTLADH